MWVVGAAANAAIAVAYLAVAAAVLVPIGRSGGRRDNRLGVATAAVFLTGAVHHGAHTLQLLSASNAPRSAIRASYGWESVIWDVLTAAVGVCYLALQRHFGPLTNDPRPERDARQRERQALELNDNVLQGLVVAKLALELGQHDKAHAALGSAIGSASRLVTDLLGNQAAGPDSALVRSRPAALSGVMP